MRRAERRARRCGPRPMKLSGAASTATPAAIMSPRRNASVTSAASVATDKPDTTGITASAARLAVRAIALFTPDPTLTWSESTAPMTVAVSGATNVTSPSPNNTAPGSTSAVHPASEPMRDSRSRPAAVSNGPTVSCSRGPMRWANEPDADENTSIRNVAGSSADPRSQRRPTRRRPAARRRRGRTTRRSRSTAGPSPGS